MSSTPSATANNGTASTSFINTNAATTNSSRRLIKAPDFNFDTSVFRGGREQYNPFNNGPSSSLSRSNSRSRSTNPFGTSDYESIPMNDLNDLIQGPSTPFTRGLPVKKNVLSRGTHKMKKRFGQFKGKVTGSSAYDLNKKSNAQTKRVQSVVPSNEKVQKMLNSPNIFKKAGGTIKNKLSMGNRKTKGTLGITDAAEIATDVAKGTSKIAKITGAGKKILDGIGSILQAAAPSVLSTLPLVALSNGLNSGEGNTIGDINFYPPNPPGTSSPEDRDFIYS